MAHTTADRCVRFDHLEVGDGSVADAEYKDLSKVERAFRSLKTVDLKVRPIYHRKPDRVHAHVLLCMLAYYVEWHMRSKLAPVLFDDHEPQAGERQRPSVMQPAHRRRSAGAQLPQPDQRVGRTMNTMQVSEDDGTFQLMTQPTALQQRCFELLGVSPRM